MLALAAFIMRGRAQAAIASGLGVLTSLLAPPVTLLAAAAFGLVTLRDGAVRGAQIGLGAALLCAVAGLALAPQPQVLMLTALAIWLPVWLLALVLRTTRSLDLTLTAALAVAAALVLGLFLFLNDQQAAWAALIQPMAEALQQAEVIGVADSERFVTLLAQWMGGILAAGLFLQVVFSLLLARWWQSMLYNPGGFREEFHGLRLPKALAGLSFGLMVATLLGGAGSASMIDHLTLVFLSGFFLQGLALAHGSVGLLKANIGWLVLLYALLLVALPQMITLLATLGLVDAMMDFRARLARGRGIPPSGN